MGVFIDKVTHASSAHHSSRTTGRDSRKNAKEKNRKRNRKSPTLPGWCMHETNEGFGFDDGFGFGFLSPMTKDAAAERAL